MRPMKTTHKLAITATSAALAAAVHLAHTPEAEACGCFAPPDPSVPIVQTGERIAFAMEDGNVVAHIQIQYSGDPEEFAWLVPMPSVPQVGVGTDELFTQLIATTQPKYRITVEYEGTCWFNRDDSDGNNLPPASPDSGAEDDGPLVVRDVVGPYEYAVLNAADKQEMLTWLTTEGFFVPAGTEAVVDPYIRPNAYFLALKLRKGASVGDLQPVVVKYQSQLPMIPIVLTSVAADPDMGILVWVLGEHRAIPRNYHHTIINDAAIDWFNFGANYIDVVTRAANQAERGQTFVTEYAGTSSIMLDLIDYPGRFGDIELLRQTTDARTYIEYVVQNGYAGFVNTFPPQLSGQFLTIMERHLPMPSGLAALGVTPSDYYLSISYYLGDFRAQNPDLFVDADLEFTPALLTAELEERIVQPTLGAGALFRDHPYLTRMFTTLSPDEMTRDPAFSFNPGLPEISNIHVARLVYECDLAAEDPSETPARLITEQGWELPLPEGTNRFVWPTLPDMPPSRTIERLPEEGPAEQVKSFDDEIKGVIKLHSPQSGGGGCSVSTRPDAGSVAGFALLALIGAVVLRRRRG